MKTVFSRQILVIFALSIVASMLVIGWASTLNWHGAINFNVPPPSFSVWNQQTEGSNYTSPYNLDFGDVYNGTVETRTFYIQNDGGYALNVTVTNEEIENCTVKWDDYTFILQPGSMRVQNTLNITVTGSGWYIWDFTAESS